MSGSGNAPDTQSDGSWYDLFPSGADDGAPAPDAGGSAGFTSQPGLFGGEWYSRAADAAANGMDGSNWAGPDANADLSGDGTGLPASVTIAPNLPQLPDPIRGADAPSPVAAPDNPPVATGAGDIGNPDAVVRYDLPGVGQTYFDPEFARRLDAFRAKAHADDIPLTFSSGYRAQVHQDGLRNAPGAITPARHSLHSTGDAVDVPHRIWNSLDPATRDKLVADANAAGLTWGGTFKRPGPDPVHFQFDPAPEQDRVKRIAAFARNVAAFQRKYPGQ